MCGICGVVYSHPDRPVNREMLRHMTDIMCHRGPDSQGFYAAPGIGLGIRRLSIIDLETGDQPISNEDKTVTVVCNGEIYNFQELRQELLAAGHRFKIHSDIEVIVHLYEDYGVQCVDHLRSDVPVGAWLSSGIDSSAVVSLMSRFTKHPVQTFTLAFENSDYDEVSQQKILKDFSSYDLSNQQAVCTTNDFKLIRKAIWHCEDPIGPGIGIARMLLSQLASKNVKVVLTGEGSDEVFGGYSWFRTDKLLRLFSKLSFGMCRFIARVPAVRKRWPRATRILRAPAEMNLARYKQIIDSAIPEIDYRVFSEDLKQRLIDNEDTEDNMSLPQDFDKYHPFAQLQYLEMKVRLSDYIIRNLDATSMAYSLEVRVPFLDHELVELCNQIPPALKMRGLQEKHILRQAMRDNLPPEIHRRRKRALSAPYGQWIRDLPEFSTE